MLFDLIISLQQSRIDRPSKGLEVLVVLLKLVRTRQPLFLTLHAQGVIFLLCLARGTDGCLIFLRRLFNFAKQ
ncbi:hypothetical protein SDC9_131004 [bioreactor metagenome]|uniref:Uncharacterized protein n=1 Tax=bioreactor metagenome TaxID=1076179 RepID=A0A645D3Q5_9ZZZZ